MVLSGGLVYFLKTTEKKIVEPPKLSGGFKAQRSSFGKSENLSKIFFAEILVFDHDYEGKSSSSNDLLWISFIFF